jgi:hypothetical protein
LPFKQVVVWQLPGGTLQQARHGSGAFLLGWTFLLNTVAGVPWVELYHSGKVKLFNRLKLSLSLTLVIMIHQQPTPAPPQLSRRAFWDTEPAALDFQRYVRFIITRVFERGTPADQQALLRYYGKETIVATLTRVPTLLSLARERAKQLFHLSDPDFACSTSKTSFRRLVPEFKAKRC